MAPGINTRNSMLVAVTVALLGATSVAAHTMEDDAIASGNVVARCQSLLASSSSSWFSSTATLAVRVKASDLPSDLSDVLAANALEWDSLNDVMRVGLLWAYGYVLPGAPDGSTSPIGSEQTLLKVYTDCSADGTAGTYSETARGVSMDALEISVASFTQAQCTLNTCGASTFFQSNNKDCASTIKTSVQCAIDGTATLPPSSGSFWSSASAGNTAIPYPQAYTHNITVARATTTNGTTTNSPTSSISGPNTTTTFVSLHMMKSGTDVKTECGNTGDAVIPCLRLSDIGTRAFCRPIVDTTSVTALLTVIATQLASSSSSSGGGKKTTTKTDNANSDTSGLSTGAIIGIAGGALVVLGLLAFYFLRNRRSTMPPSHPDSTNTPTTLQDPFSVLDPKMRTGQHPDFSRNHSTNFVVLDYSSRENDTVVSTDMYSLDEPPPPITQQQQHHQPHSGNNAVLYPTQSSGMSSRRLGNNSSGSFLQSGTKSGRSRESSVGDSSRGVPFGKTEQDYMDESDILRDFLTDPQILMRRIPHDELNTLRILSKGSYGEVFLGQLETRHVAMKRLLPEKKHLTRSIEQFTAEIRLMCHLEHRNIVSFIGVSWNYVSNICAVVEYMDNGDLHDVLAKNKGKFTWPKEKISISMDIAEGLVYLHSMRPVIVHRDLKSKNVLLNKRGHAKLSDFGVSRKTTVNETMTSGVGTLLWTAPEIIEGRKYSEKADVFSLGVVLSEIDTGEEPYAKTKSDATGERLPGMQLVQMVRMGQLRVSFRDDCPRKLRELATQCTSLDPDARPTSMEVAYTLKSIIAPRLRRA